MNSTALWKQRTSLLLLMVAAGISISWGIALERGGRLGVMGFPGIYFGTRCLIQGGDPYDVGQLQRVYDSAGFSESSSVALRQSANLYVNLPATFLLVAPFALLPLAVGQTVWLVILIGTFLLAGFLMWNLADAYSPAVALLLSFIALANCEIIFSGGNTAGLVVSLCVIAVWCFLQGRCIPAGILCLALGLAVKPHDAGLIWLYFILAGRVHRMRALKALGVSLILALAALAWVTRVAPNWVPELRSNLATISGHGGINEPGPTSIGVNSPDMIIDLQTLVSVFADDPGIYNPLTYAVCAVLFAGWSIAVLKFSRSPQNAWFALVSASALSMLVTYHRTYDAKLLLLAIPACAMLWAQRGVIAWVSLVLTAGAFVFTADIPLAILVDMTRNRYSPTASFAEKGLTALLTRPAPILLSAIAVFYLAVFACRARSESIGCHNLGTDITS